MATKSIPPNKKRLIGTLIRFMDSGTEKSGVVRYIDEHVTKKNGKVRKEYSLITEVNSDELWSVPESSVIRSN